MNFAATTFCPTKSPVRSIVVVALHPLFAPRSPQTPSLPDARPRSDRFRCGGRESNFLAAKAVLDSGELQRVTSEVNAWAKEQINHKPLHPMAGNGPV
jgi:hypothetical protein